MKAEAARLKRLQRLEQVRSIARQHAAREAAAAESTLAQLEALAARTTRLADDYRGRTALANGQELRQLARFVAGLDTIRAATHGDAAQARTLADARQRELAEAERRRAAVEDRARAAQLALDRAAAPLVLGARRQTGTGLE